MEKFRAETRAVKGREAPTEKARVFAESIANYIYIVLIIVFKIGVPNFQIAHFVSKTIIFCHPLLKDTTNL